jgi:hypothetical protein
MQSIHQGMAAPAPAAPAPPSATGPAWACPPASALRCQVGGWPGGKGTPTLL